MDKFFAKQITESPRHKDRWGAKGAKKASRAVVALDPDLEHEEGEEHLRHLNMSMSKGNKDFTDKLGPLQRYLLQSVGRPWDEVFSEISQNIPSNSMQGRHIRQHVDGYVEQDVLMIEGKPHSFPEYGSAPRLITYDFYVHPETGLLQKPPGSRGLYLTPDGRRLHLETWVRRHLGKSVEKVRGILLLSRDEYGRPPKDDDIQKGMLKVGVVDDRGLLQPKAPGARSAQLAETRRLKAAEVRAKKEAVERVMEKARREKKMEKRRKNAED